MKNLIIILTLISLFSCSKKDDTPQPFNSNTTVSDELITYVFASRNKVGVKLNYIYDSYGNKESNVYSHPENLKVGVSLTYNSQKINSSDTLIIDKYKTVNSVVSYLGRYTITEGYHTLVSNDSNTGI